MSGPSGPSDAGQLDIQIGQLIRAHRIAKGWSQDDLAKRVGLSFQQVQKYENGSSRLLASKLYEFAVVFGVDVSVFFKGLPGIIGEDKHVDSSTVFSNDTWKLAAQFDLIEDKETRSRIMDLVSTLVRGNI